MKPEQLTKQGVDAYLACPAKVQVVEEIDSTNNELKHRCRQLPHGTVLIAKHQTAGKGRMGRSFYAHGGGVYLSILYKNLISTDQLVLVTVAASVAVSRAVKAVVGTYPEIKWVNDLYLQGRKVCGILAEAVHYTERERYLVLGVGLNCDTVFPEELKEIAGNLSEEYIDKNRLAAEVIHQLWGLEEMLETSDFLEEYRTHSMVVGKVVTLPQEPESCYLAEAIDQNGGLVLRDAAGQRRILSTGEISVRVKKMD